MKKTAVLFLAHSMNAELLRRFRLIADQLPGGVEAFFALDATRTRVCDRISKKLARQTNLFIFSREILSKLPYRRAREEWRGRSVVPGLQDLVPQLFRRLNPEFDYIYFVEYDILYTGEWKNFFAHFQESDASFLTTSIAPKSEVPVWEHFATFQPDRPLPETHIIRGFMPICRYSTEGLLALEERYRRGWRGHHEVLVPTAILDAGLKLEDFGGDGSFVRKGNENRFYTSSRLAENFAPGSFVFIPGPSEVPRDRPVLMHPCKTSLGLDLRTLIDLIFTGRHDVASTLSKCLSDPRVSATRS